MAETLHGKDFVALRRLSDAQNRPIAEVGETCARVPAPVTKPGEAPRTVSDALRLLLASGKIARVPKAPPEQPAPPPRGDA